jgi:membrane protease YdiL (CAAX protease family)
MKKLPVTLSQNTFYQGLIYMLIQQLMLPQLLSTVLVMINKNATSADLNFAFFSINYVASLIIFRKFIQQEADHALKNIGRVFLCVLVCYIAYSMMINFVSTIIYMLDPDYANLNDAYIDEMSQKQFAMMAVGTVLLVPPAEELLFRGVLFNRLYQKKPVLGCALSICLFSLVHLLGYIGQYTPLQFFLAFLQYVPAGIALCSAYIFSGTIFAPILLHTVINGLGMLSLYLMR